MIGDEPRKAIKGGEWVVKISLEVNDETVLEMNPLRYVDTYLADLPKKAHGTPEDAGYLIAQAIDQQARRWLTRKK